MTENDLLLSGSALKYNRYTFSIRKHRELGMLIFYRLLIRLINVYSGLIFKHVGQWTLGCLTGHFMFHLSAFCLYGDKWVVLNQSSLRHIGEVFYELYEK